MGGATCLRKRKNRALEGTKRKPASGYGHLADNLPARGAGDGVAIMSGHSGRDTWRIRDDIPIVDELLEIFKKGHQTRPSTDETTFLVHLI